MYESNAHEILSKCYSKKVFISTSADHLLDYYRVCLKLTLLCMVTKETKKPWT